MKTFESAMETSPRFDNHAKGICGNSVSVADGVPMAEGGTLPETQSLSVFKSALSKSEGGNNASVLGCNANNANGGRYLNANNAASNRNDNYAGAFAVTLTGRERPHRDPQGRTSRLENHAATGGYGRDEYGSLPFMDDGNAESNVNLCQGMHPNMDAPVWQELKEANLKRNLKGLRKFYLDKDIVTYAVNRCLEGKDARRLIQFFDHISKAEWTKTVKSGRTDGFVVELIVSQIIREIGSETYYVRGYEVLEIDRRHATDKRRMAKVFTIYDRCVQMVVLTVIEQKLRHKVLRNNYSNIEGRGILCNDKKYCMLNKIRTFCWKYPNDVILLTDIKKFYDNVSWKVMCGVVFETVKDTTTRWLIAITLRAAGTLPIGSCLSPLFADILMNDYDNIILRDFKPDFFAAFGDNRCFGCDKELAVRIQQFTKSYYPGRYGVQLKDDYQIKPVSVGFSFCKTQYCKGFTRVRAELRRRAIKAAPHSQSFAGYNGMLEKTDSKHLLYLIKRHIKAMKDAKGMDIPSFKGEPKEFDYFKDKRVCVTDYRRVNNRKDSGYYYVFQVVAKEPDGMKLYNTHNGSKDIKAAGDYFMEKSMAPPIYVTVRKVGDRGFYFEEYYTSVAESCAAIVQNMNIQL